MFLKFTCWSVFGAWIFLFLSILFFIYGFLDKAILGITAVIFGAFILLAAIGTVTSFKHRCPTCKKRFLFETPGPKHTAARKLGPFDNWATVIIDVLFNNYFVCMYCGEKYNVESGSYRDTILNRKNDKN